LIFKGILQQSLGQKTEADQSFTQAEEVLNSREQFLLARGQRYYLLNQNDAALADAQAVMGINPDSSGAYLLAGEAYENLGKYQEAVNSYQKASSLAEAQNNPSQVAFIRMRLAMLEQQLSAPAVQP
ncbi:MAG: tetratricopeptide repeat protein, partial [Omnitrophica WOR_2 bacterium]